MSADNGFIECMSNLEAKMELLISELEVVKKLNTSLKLQIENNTLYSEDLYDTLCSPLVGFGWSPILIMTISYLLSLYLDGFCIFYWYEKRLIELNWIT